MFGEFPRTKLLTICLLMLALFPTSAALADDPTGVWLTNDKAEITIERCGADFCVIVSKPAKPGLKDIRNPDPELNGQPILGMPLLRVSHVGGQNRMTGELYNPFDGKMYQGSLELIGENELRVRGCVLKVICLHEDWVRIGS